MRLICYLFLLILIVPGCKKDPPLPEPIPAEFQKTYGDMGDEVAYSIIETPDKNYLIAGSTSSYGSGSQDVYLLKTDPGGNVLWQKTFGGANVDIGYSLTAAKDGNWLVTGVAKSFTIGVGLDVFLVKTDQNGNLLWQKTYGTVYNDGANAIVALADNSGYVLAGATGGVNLLFFGSNYLIKVNENGDTLWTKKFGGSNGGDEAISAAADGSGNFYIFSNTYSDGPTDKGLQVMKLSSAGDSLWAMSIDGIEREEASKIKMTNDGGFILSGYTTSFGDADGDLYAIKIGPGGTVAWQKTFGGTDYDRGKDVIQTRDGGLLFAGTSKSYGNGTSDIILIKTDGSGIEKWMKVIGTDKHDEVCAIMETDDAYLMAGSTRTGSVQNDLDLFLVKIKKP